MKGPLVWKIAMLDQKVWFLFRVKIGNNKMCLADENKF